MTLRRLAAAIAFSSLAACGGGGKPCSGSACLQVAGTYAVLINQTPQTTCMYIGYGTANQAELQVTQSGGKLTLAFSNSPIDQSETGTLNTNGTAVFTASGQVSVTDDRGDIFPYDDSNTLDLTFTSSDGGAVSVSGQVSDTLAAIMPSSTGYPDSDCILEGSINGSD